MGIGVSYTGVGGGTTSFTAQGGNAALSELQRLQTESGSMLQQIRQRRGGGGGSAPRTTNEQRRQTEERELEAKYERLRARGIYREGKRKSNPFEEWADKLGKEKNKVDLDKIDPRRSGGDITGIAKSDKSASDTSRIASSKEPFTESYISDLFLEEVLDENENKVGYQLYKYRRRRSNTGQGRVFAVSKEEREPVGAMIPLGGSAEDNGMFAWNNGTIGAGGVFVGRKFYTIAGSSGNSGTALYSVKVEFGSGGAISASVVSTATIGQAPTDTVCYIPIYEVADGAIVHDYRGAFVVPCWE
jgi:hypothetical protein